MSGNGNVRARRGAPRKITKESDAWFALAEAYDRLPVDSESPLFLCDVARGCSSRIPESPYASAIIDRIDADLNDDRSTAYGELAIEGPVHRGRAARRNKPARVLACLMFGWEAKSEGR